MRFIKRVSGEEKRMNEAMNSAIAIALAQQREEIAKELESAVIEVVGNSAATMDQAARIVRGMK